MTTNLVKSLHFNRAENTLRATVQKGQLAPSVVPFAVSDNVALVDIPFLSEDIEGGMVQITVDVGGVDALLFTRKDGSDDFGRVAVPSLCVPDVLTQEHLPIFKYAVQGAKDALDLSDLSTEDFLIFENEETLGKFTRKAVRIYALGSVLTELPVKKVFGSKVGDVVSDHWYRCEKNGGTLSVLEELGRRSEREVAGGLREFIERPSRYVEAAWTMSRTGLIWNADMFLLAQVAGYALNAIGAINTKSEKLAAQEAHHKLATASGKALLENKVPDTFTVEMSGKKAKSFDVTLTDIVVINGRRYNLGIDAQRASAYTLTSGGTKVDEVKVGAAK